MTPVFYHEGSGMAMTNEELVRQIQNGDKALIPQLWEQVEKFVSQRAGMRSRKLEGFGGATEEDMYQSGFLALIDAIDSFDPEAGKSFVGWLDLHLKTAFAEAGGYRSKRQARDPLHAAGSLYAPLGGDMEDITLADTIQDPQAAQEMEAVEERIWNEQLRKTLTEELGRLPKAERDVVEGKYYMGRTCREMGPDTQQLKDRAFRKLRRRPSLQRFIGLRTPYYHHVGVDSFSSTHTSAVEWIVLERERLSGALYGCTERTERN